MEEQQTTQNSNPMLITLAQADGVTTMNTNPVLVTFGGGGSGNLGVEWGHIGGDMDDQVDLKQALDGKQNLSEKGAANGYTPLGADSKVPAQYLSISGGLTYKGSWNASTNTPTLADGVGTNGDMYKVSVSGTQNLGSGDVVFNEGDHIVYVGAPDNKWENFGTSESVSSVNGKTGAVVLDADDVGALSAPAGFNAATVIGKNFGGVYSPVTYSQDTNGFNLVMRDIDGQIPGVTPTADAHLANKKYVDDSITSATGGGVTSVNGRTGAVTLTKSDVGLANVDNTPDATKPISSPVQTALNAKENLVPVGTSAQYYRGDKTWQTLNKTAVGLSNVDNTSDLNKPISTATQTALNAKIGLTSQITGYAGGVPSAIVATDTIIQAFQHAQGQIDQKITLSSAMTGYQKLVASPLSATDSILVGMGKLEGLFDEAITMDYVPPVWDSVALPDQPIALGDSIYDFFQKLQGQVENRVMLENKADQTAAEAGQNDAMWMTPLKTKQAIVALGGGGGGTPGGANTQLQYNNNGAFAGIPSVTYLDSGTPLGGTGLVLNGTGGYPMLIMGGTDESWAIDNVLGDFCIERINGGLATGNFVIRAESSGDAIERITIAGTEIDLNGTVKVNGNPISGGVPATSSPNRVYVTTPGGDQSYIPYSNSNAEANAMAQYSSAGNLFTAAPTDPQHATNKEYVDTAIASNTPGWQITMLDTDVTSMSTTHSSTPLSINLPTEEVSTIFEYELYVWGPPAAGISFTLDGTSFDAITMQATATGLDGGETFTTNKDVTLGTAFNFDIKNNVTKITICGYLDGLKQGEPDVHLSLSMGKQTATGTAIYLLAGSSVRYKNS